MENIESKEKLIYQALEKVIDPELGNNLVSLNMIKSVNINNSSVEVTVELTTAGCPLKTKIEEDCINQVSAIKGINEVKIHFTSRSKPINNEIQLPNVKKIIAISSSKGGVGKSTIAINIARAFSESGYSVGLLDGDVYGPNIPSLLDNFTRPKVTSNNKLVPVEDNGIRFISMGLLIEKAQPVIWRGAMLHGVVKQFLSDVEWGNLDFLFVDLPPGTGDVQLSLCQLINLSGAIVITTPQQLSVADVRKGIGMFRQLQVDIIGIIENMSYYIHPGTNDKIYIFGKDGGYDLAKEWNIPLLAQIPIDPAIGERSENALKYIRPLVERILTNLNMAKK